MSDKPTGVKTAGIGKRTKRHLNLTVSMADARKRDMSTKRRRYVVLLTAEERSRRISEGLRQAAKAKFAGFDPREIRLQLPRAE